MITTLWILAVLGFIVVGGILFSALHPDLQRWGTGLPNSSKK